MDKNLLIDTFISQYNKEFEVIRHIHSDKINIEKTVGRFMTLKFMRIMPVIKLKFSIFTQILIIQKY